jgi:hypothetical protein
MKLKFINFIFFYICAKNTHILGQFQRTFGLKFFFQVVFKNLFHQPKFQLKRANGLRVILFLKIDNKLKNMSNNFFLWKIIEKHNRMLQNSCGVPHRYPHPVQFELTFYHYWFQCHSFPHGAPVLETLEDLYCTLNEELMFILWMSLKNSYSLIKT